MTPVPQPWEGGEGTPVAQPWEGRALTGHDTFMTMGETVNWPLANISLCRFTTAPSAYHASHYLYGFEQPMGQSLYLHSSLIGNSYLLTYPCPQ